MTKFSVWVAAGSLPLAVFAGESTCQLKLTADRADGRYGSGETASFVLSGTIGGKPIPAGAKFDGVWRCGDERGERFTLVAEGDAPKVARPVSETCYYTLSLMPLGADGKPLLRDWQKPQCSVLCDLEKMRMPEGTMPADFDAWWESEVAAQRKIPMEVDRKVRGLYDGADETRRKVIDSRPWMRQNYEKCACYDVRIRAAGENWVAGGLVIPKKPGRHPVVVCFYGVGWDGVCEIDTLRAVSMNAIYFCVNAHGLPKGASWETDYPAMRRRIEAYAATNPAWQKIYPKIGTGEGREKWYYRYVFLRAARAIEYVKTLPEWDGRTLIVSGRSQGAAQSVAAAALEPGVTHMMLGIPAMTDFSGARSTPKRRCAWPFNVRNDAPYPEAGYYDTVNFAHRLHGKQINLAFGVSDGLVQPCGPACLYNALPADNEKTLVTAAVRGHDSPWCFGIFDPMIRKVCTGK